MDYLTILSTARLILFSDPSSLPAIPSSPTGPLSLLLLDNSSPLSSPSTPTNPLCDLNAPLTPTPIVMPLSSIMYSDTHTAYFLVHHIMTSSINHISHEHHHHEHHDETLGHTCAGGGWGWNHGPRASANTNREMMIEAEVIAWKEIDRAKMFARAVGRVFQGFGEGRKMRDRELKELAARFGLGVQDGQEKEDDDEGKEEEQGSVPDGGSHEKTPLVVA
ncbi:hypothetical protein IAT40_003729 [Kwoniella sp. CBS 6097]